MCVCVRACVRAWVCVCHSMCTVDIPLGEKMDTVEIDLKRNQPPKFKAKSVIWRHACILFGWIHFSGAAKPSAISTVDSIAEIFKLCKRRYALLKSFSCSAGTGTIRGPLYTIFHFWFNRLNTKFNWLNYFLVFLWLMEWYNSFLISNENACQMRFTSYYLNMTDVWRIVLSF